MDAKRFRIAFSFAGEKRDFVEKTADLLAKTFGKEAILYDKYHEAEFARWDLGIYLPKFYGLESDLIVPVLCPVYDEKRWTGWEWVHIYGLLTRNDGYRVMPSRFGHAEADGLSPAAGFIELDQKTPEQFASLILERLAINEGKARDHYARPAEPPPARPRPPSIPLPNNLPRLQPFFGREAELRTIREALDPGSSAWGILIEGPGGMGKTALAVRAALDCPPGLFQRIVFVSAKARELDDDGERSLGSFLVPGFLELLNVLARELGEPDIAKAPEDQRLPLLVETLRRAPALLVLDNLESLPKSDRDRLFTFVQRLPQGCKALLTSRRRIGPGGEELVLDPLDRAAALATLTDLARHNKLLARTSEAERVALHDQTGGKPLLLRWVAGQLGRGSCRTLADALAFLRSCPPENDPLEFIFGDLAGGFSGDEERVLCALTFFSRQTGVAHLADVAGIEAAAADTALCTLANRSLATPDQKEERYALVPMVAEFLRRRRPEDVAAAGGRLEERAFALVDANGYRQYARFAAIDAAWDLVEPALALFAAGPSERLQTACEALRFYLEFAGHWDEWFSLEQQGEAKALAAGDYHAAGWRAYQMGWVYYQRRQAEDVMTCVNRAVGSWQRAEVGPKEKSEAFRLRGQAYVLRENFGAAIADLRMAARINLAAARESVEVALSLNSLAIVEDRAGQMDLAEKHFIEAFRVACRVGHEEMMAAIPGNLADISLRRGNWARAEAVQRDGLARCEKVGRQEIIASGCCRLATALAHLGRIDEARPYAQRGIEIFTRLRSPRLEPNRTQLRACGALPA